MRKQKILIPLDGSDFSRKIFPYINQFFKPEEAELLLFHLTPKLQAVHLHKNSVHYDIYVDQIEASKQSELEVAFHEDIAKLKEAGYTTRLSIGFGDDPAETIVAMVQQEEIDLIAMTTHGYTGLHRMLAGSVAEHVLRNVNVPVLLLRPFTKPLVAFQKREPLSVADLEMW